MPHITASSQSLPCFLGTEYLLEGYVFCPSKRRVRNVDNTHQLVSCLLAYWICKVNLRSVRVLPRLNITCQKCCSVGSGVKVNRGVGLEEKVWRSHNVRVLEGNRGSWKDYPNSRDRRSCQAPKGYLESFIKLFNDNSRE